MKTRSLPLAAPVLLALAALALGQATPPAIDKVMITEVCVYGAEAVELVNFAPTPVSLAGWVVKWRFSGTTYTSAPLNVTLAPLQILVVRDANGGGPDLNVPAHVTQIAALPGITVPVGAITGVALFDGAGGLVDEVFIAGPIVFLPILESSIGGTFRGYVQTAQGPNGVYSTERVWGLDSNGGRDWCRSPKHTMGRENNGIGLRGSDIGVENVVINEVDTRQTTPINSYHTVEIEVRSATPVNLHNWYLLASGRQGGATVRINPWPTTTSIPAGGFVVLLSSSLVALPPSEMPAGTAYYPLGTSTGMLPFSANEEFSLALYDDLGHLVDIVRSCARGSEVAHNHPRAPSALDDFRGWARRPANAGIGIGREAGAFDSNTGDDWRPTLVRSMGLPNTQFADGSAPDRNVPDVRLYEGQGDGLSLIVNGGTTLGNRPFYLLFTLGHGNGTGTLMGLSFDAVTNFAAYSMAGLEPFAATLDSDGSYRFEFPPFSVPAGIQTDNVAIVLNPSLPGGATRTNVLRFDT